MLGLEVNNPIDSMPVEASQTRSVPLLLAQRALRAVVTHTLLCAVVLSTTEYAKRYPSGVGAAVALFASVSVFRLLVARRMLRTRVSSGKYRGLLYLTTLAAAGLWGLCAAGVVTLGVTSDTMVVLVVTAGISAGAITSLAPELALAQAYSAAVLVPLIVAGFMQGDSAAIGVSLGAAVFLGFSLMQSAQSHAEFVTAEANVERLQRRAIALEEARGTAEAAQREALRASRAKSSLLTDVSHEIRGPMVSILGYSELLGASGVSDDTRMRHAAAIHRSGQHLMEIINDILDTTRLEAGKMSFIEEPVQVSQILADVDAAMCIRAQQRHLEFEIKIDTPVPEQIRTDPLRLRQILLNLVGNAIKFTDSGRVSIRACFDEAHRRMFFHVTDTGVGLSAEQIARLFERFVQVHSTNRLRSQGSGVGLALSRAMARELGGDITVTSTVGTGSTFTLELPVRESDGVSLVSHVSANISHSSGTFAAHEVRLALRAIVADDDSDLRALTVEFLTAAGASVEQATDGEQVMALVAAGLETGHPPDVVLLDMHMPLLDGYRTATLLREIGYRGTIVALTGSVGEIERQKCIDAGCDEHAAKPIHRLHLLLMLSRISGQAAKVEPASPIPAAAGAAVDETIPEPCEPLESTLATDPIIQPMLQQVLAGFGARQARLEQALEKSDLIEVARVAHDLTGLGGTFGYDELSVRAKQLARALKERHPPEAVDMAARAVLAVCRRILAANPSHDAA